jgi:Ca-activated chloride channel family protein
MATLLDPELAPDYFMQRTDRDVTIVLPFSSGVEPPHTVEGNDPAKLQWLMGKVEDEGPGGGTNIYGCLARALTFFENVSDDYAPAIILMTDGRSNEGSFSDFTEKLPADPARVVPVYSILFGDASGDQLEQIADVTRGDIYDGRDGLVKAMRDAFANA